MSDLREIGATGGDKTARVRVVLPRTVPGGSKQTATSTFHRQRYCALSYGRGPRALTTNEE